MADSWTRGLVLRLRGVVREVQRDPDQWRLTEAEAHDLLGPGDD